MSLRPITCLVLVVTIAVCASMMPLGPAKVAAQSGACPPSVNAVPLFADTTVISPDASVPPELAAYSGWWGGPVTGSSLNVIVVVESISPPYATVVYATADTKQPNSHSLTRLLGTFQDGQLTIHLGFGNPAIDATFSINADGTLSEGYQYNGPVTATAILAPMAPVDPCPLHQLLTETFRLASAGLLPSSARDATPGALSFLFRVAGFFPGSLSRDQLQAAVTPPDGSLGWHTGPGVLVVDMDPATPTGIYTVSFSLPDGRQTETGFSVNTSPDFLDIHFGTRMGPATPGDPATYSFQVTGTDLQALVNEFGRDAVQQFVTAPNGSTVTIIPGVGIPPFLSVQVPSSIPNGSYTVTLTLPDGRSATATFQHMQ